jgi:valyl-tRNA synthetase
LANEQFLAKAPAQVIENMRKRVAELGILQGKARGQMAEMGV